MFTRKVYVGGASVRTYKTVTDWGEVWGMIIVVVVILLIVTA